VHSCLAEGCTIIEAIEAYCNEHGDLEVDEIVHLIDAQMKDKIENYAISHNLFRKNFHHLGV
jgi:hypothetical protein